MICDPHNSHVTLASGGGDLSSAINKPARKNFPRRKVIMYGIDDWLKIDLVEMNTDHLKGISGINNGYKYIMTNIDVFFSKYAFATPIKEKTAKNIVNGLECISMKIKPHSIQKLIQKYNINHYSSWNELKASVVSFNYKFDRFFGRRKCSYTTTIAIVNALLRDITIISGIETVYSTTSSDYINAASVDYSFENSYTTAFNIERNWSTTSGIERNWVTTPAARVSTVLSSTLRGTGAPPPASRGTGMPPLELRVSTALSPTSSGIGVLPPVSRVSTPPPSTSRGIGALPPVSVSRVSTELPPALRVEAINLTTTLKSGAGGRVEREGSLAKAVLQQAKNMFWAGGGGGMHSGYKEPLISDKGTCLTMELEGWRGSWSHTLRCALTIFIPSSSASRHADNIAPLHTPLPQHTKPQYNTRAPRPAQLEEGHCTLARAGDEHLYTKTRLGKVKEAARIAESRMEGARVCETQLVASSSHQTALGRASSAARRSSQRSSIAADDQQEVDEQNWNIPMTGQCICFGRNIGALTNLNCLHAHRHDEGSVSRLVSQDESDEMQLRQNCTNHGVYDPRRQPIHLLLQDKKAWRLNLQHSARPSRRSFREKQVASPTGRRSTTKTPQSPARRGDGALVARASVALTASALLSGDELQATAGVLPQWHRVDVPACLRWTICEPTHRICAARASPTLDTSVQGQRTGKAGHFTAIFPLLGGGVTSSALSSFLADFLVPLPPHEESTFIVERGKPTIQREDLALVEEVPPTSRDGSTPWPRETSCPNHLGNRGLNLSSPPCGAI
ncbi:hypothetical protein PR048_024570 [Dryococelus australis]|uniref:Uncharacterized protein n=1 Tax=Dryococelus australis TaxID=614101 RepID=A0ABQ9GNZ6_9NEOP|nr:hypothetical protein PR048_024570 [Dryococelus australis]